MRPLKVKASELALRVPVIVGPTGNVRHDEHEYQVPAAAIGIGGTPFLDQGIRQAAPRVDDGNVRRLPRGRGLWEGPADSRMV